MEIGKVMVARRGRSYLGISQEDLADRTGISKYRIGEFERDEKSPSWEEMVKIGSELGLSTVRAWDTISNECD